MDEKTISATWPATLTTPRLLVRPAESDDASDFRPLWTDTAVRKYLGGPVDEQKLPAYERALGRLLYVFSVIETSESSFVGTVHVDASSSFAGRREISYSFLPAHWGRGYAREAVSVVLAWAFDAVPSEDPTIIAVTQEANARSCRMLEALGMTKIDSFIKFDAPQAMYEARRPA
ncbi:GNAT family N-acetyltransferase [Glycomyces buryatensis]|uniref:GNAT family N-acetyltransferase n=1 Tax=Glycomyces buryatensis TaxID=2570927 RepID=A0A4S8QHR3_9ACTN|nr:GNAT family N-acetyltransferase [Glycomyces buryatensis]THV42515.1 GNAT family N-acetyltransferase [Glycomyces buryatensis]